MKVLAQRAASSGLHINLRHAKLWNKWVWTVPFLMRYDLGAGGGLGEQKVPELLRLRVADHFRPGEGTASPIPWKGSGALLGCQHLVSPYTSPVSRGKAEQEMKCLAWQVGGWRKPAFPSCVGMRGREEEVCSGTCKPWALVEHQNHRVGPLRSSHSCKIISLAIFTLLYSKKKPKKPSVSSFYRLAS